MTTEIFDLYQKCLPDIVRGEEKVKQILGDKDNHIIVRRQGSALIGVSVINENIIYLLCVDEPLQHQGIGGELLNESEQFMKAQGFSKVILGAGKEYIMPGVPMKHGAHNFFQKRGYVHSWGETGCFDMEQDLRDFVYNDHSVGDAIDGVTYKWATPEYLEQVVLCVADAEAKFVPIYQNKEYYHEGTIRPILIAITDGEVAGAVLLYVGSTEDMGSVGAVATAHKYRNRGIATNMVLIGTRHLKDVGLSRATLGYTYTQIVHMYGRAGYKVSQEYFMGEKIFG